MDKSNDGLIGNGFGIMIALLLVALKLCGVITWSWWWVLSPVWAPLLVAFGIIAVIAVIERVFQKINNSVSDWLPLLLGLVAILFYFLTIPLFVHLIVAGIFVVATFGCNRKDKNE